MLSKNLCIGVLIVSSLTTSAHALTKADQEKLELQKKEAEQTFIEMTKYKYFIKGIAFDGAGICTIVEAASKGPVRGPLLFTLAIALFKVGHTHYKHAETYSAENKVELDITECLIEEIRTAGKKSNQLFKEIFTEEKEVAAEKKEIK